MGFEMIYSFAIEGNGSEQCAVYYKKVNLPFPPPIGATVWLPEEADEGSTCFPTIVVEHEHWAKKNRYDVNIGFDEDAVNTDVESLGGFLKLCEILEFHGWKTDPRDL